MTHLESAKVSIPEATRKYQIGMVFRDARKAAENFTRLFGVGPFVEEVYPGISATVHGKPTDYRILAFSANMGPVELELCQVIDGRPIHQEFLETRGEGIHHIGLYVDNEDE